MKKTIILLTGIALTAGLSAHAQSTIADWTFETSAPLTAGPFNPESGAGSISGSHAAGSTAYSTPAGNGSAHSFSANDWANNDYYLAQVNTTGYSSITVAFDQTSSNTGPGQFQLLYSTDGVNYTLVKAYSVLADAAPNTAWSATGSDQSAYTISASLPTAAAEDATLYLKIEDESTTSANGGTIGTSGTDRIDNVIVEGVADVPEPATMALFGLGGTIGLGFVRRFRK